VSHTIDDISYEQMSRIVRRLNRMSREDRGASKRVAEVLLDELGANKALVYVEKAFANGAIQSREYYALRGFIVLPKPREVTVAPTAGIASQQLIEGEKKLQQQFGQLTEAGKEALGTPFRMLDKDVKRLRRAWGL